LRRLLKTFSDGAGVTFCGRVFRPEMLGSRR